MSWVLFRTGAGTASSCSSDWLLGTVKTSSSSGLCTLFGVEGLRIEVRDGDEDMFVMEGARRVWMGLRCGDTTIIESSNDWFELASNFFFRFVVGV